MSSAPLRYGSLSPTFFNEVVRVGVPSSAYVVRVLTNFAEIGTILPPKKGKAPPEAIQASFLKALSRLFLKAPLHSILSRLRRTLDTADFAKNPHPRA